MVVSQQEMERRLIRYADLIPCKNAFIDSRTPGSDKKENFTLIGPGVAESPGQHVHVKIPHGFNIGGARQPNGTVNSQHSHESEEVFLVHRGRWAFRWGPDGTDGEVILGPGDIISLPLHMFRGFENVGEDDGFLFAILGGDDPGRVTWAPYVFEQAKDHGLILTRGGVLIDTTLGEAVPEGDEPVEPTGMEEVARLCSPPPEEMAACIIREEESRTGRSALASASRGVTEVALLGPANPAEAIDAGPIARRHGFHFRRLHVEADGRVVPHARLEEEVIFVQEGDLSIGWDAGEVALGKGDTLTIPKGLMRQWSSDGGADLYVVRGGDAPAAPTWTV